MLKNLLEGGARAPFQGSHHIIFGVMNFFEEVFEYNKVI